MIYGILDQIYFIGLKSFLMTPTYKPVVGSLNDLTESSEYVFVVKKYSSIWANMMVRNWIPLFLYLEKESKYSLKNQNSSNQEANKGPFARIGNILRKYPGNSLETLDDITDLVINQKKVLGQVIFFLANSI